MRSGPVARVLRGLPRPSSVVVGVLAVALSGSLIFRPLASLAALLLFLAITCLMLAVGELTGAGSGGRWLARLKAAGWLLTTLVIVLFPGLGVAGVAIAVGVALLLDGVSDIAGAARGTRDGRADALVGGVAALILGGLALAWPDVSVMVLGVVFGVRVAWFGVALLVAALRPRPAVPAEAAPTGRGRGGRPSVRAVGALAAVLVLLVVSIRLNAASPRPDAFYDAPSRVPDRPGQLVRSEPFERALPPGARAWRILYTTTRDEGVPALASALVVAPADPPPRPRPVIAWAHGTTGVAQG